MGDWRAGCFRASQSTHRRESGNAPSADDAKRVRLLCVLEGAATFEISPTAGFSCAPDFGGAYNKAHAFGVPRA